ncbi:hypothetical protein GCM10028820_33630 [Tessaracoccus terricola]
MTSLHQHTTRTGFAAAAVALVAMAVPTGFAAADEAGDCLVDGNVWVVVEQGDAVIAEGCATDFGTGLEALTSAGIAYEAPGGFVSSIGGEPSDPGPEDWWSYWSATPAEDGALEWESYLVGAGESQPEAGTVEGWRLATSWSEQAPPPSLASVEFPAATPSPSPTPSDSPLPTPTVSETPTEAPSAEPTVTDAPSQAPSPAPTATAGVPGLPSSGV